MIYLNCCLYTTFCPTLPTYSAVPREDAGRGKIVEAASDWGVWGGPGGWDIVARGKREGIPSAHANHKSHRTFIDPHGACTVSFEYLHKAFVLISSEVIFWYYDTLLDKSSSVYNTSISKNTHIKIYFKQVQLKPIKPKLTKS